MDTKTLHTELKKIGIDLTEVHDAFQFANLFKKAVSANSEVNPYPLRNHFALYNVYKDGKVLGTNLTIDEADKLDGIREKFYDDAGFDAAKKKYSSTLIKESLFMHGLFSLENVLDHPKAEAVYYKAYDRCHSGGYQDVANEFIYLIELIHD